MNGKTTAIIAVAVAAVVIVAGAVIIFNNNNKGKTAEHGASALQIRGNANDDMTIDSDDMAILDKIIAGESTLEDYPLADANGDGEINDSDKAVLQKIIDREVGCEVYVICLDINGQTTTQKIKYPLRNVVTYGTNVQLPTLYANGGQFIAGYFTSNYDAAEGSINANAVDFKAPTRSIDDAAWAKFTTLDGNLAESGGIGALIFDYSGKAALVEKYQNDLTAAKIPLLIFSSADASSEITTVLTLGFLFGGDCETLGVNYATESWDIINKIADDTVNISDNDKTTYIGCTMYIYICQNDSTFASSGITAGGRPYHEVNEEFSTAYAGTGSVKMASVEALSNYKDIGAILNNRSMDWGLDPTEYRDQIIEAWTHDNAGISSTEYFKGFENKLAYINNLLPGAVKVAYMAHKLYDDKFSLEYADGVLMKFINLGTNPLKGQSLETIVSYVDNSVYQRAVNSSTVSVGDDSVNMLYSLYKNYTGKYKTGAAEAVYSFKPGSNADSATLSVANTNADPEKNTNTINVKVMRNAKTGYQLSYAEYSALTKAQTDPYTAATFTSDFYGAYACYLNKDGVGIAHVTGYVSNVMFDCYLYEPYSITNEDIQTLITGLYSAVTNPVTYDGPAIPTGASQGAKLAAETLAANNNKWSVSHEGGEPTEASAVAVFAGKNGMGNATNYNIPISSVYNHTAYNTAKDKILNERILEKVASGSGDYVVYNEDIGDVTYTAIYGYKASAKYCKLYFVIQKGNILIDASNVAVVVYYGAADEAAIRADANAFLTEIATAASSSSYTGAELVAKALVSNNGTAWALHETDPLTSESATVVYSGKTAMGGAKSYNISIVSNNHVAADYTTACTTLDTKTGEEVSTTSPTGDYYALYDSGIDNTKVMLGHIPSKKYTNIYFAMKSSTTLVDCSAVKITFYDAGADADVLRAAADAFLAEVAVAMTL